MLPQVTATRYVTPLREGGSLPGLMEADDLGTYVVKFVGAGQGRKTLVAEVVCSGSPSGLGLETPDLAVVDVDPGLAPAEPDEEVQDLLRASPGLNLGIDYLPGALDVDARVVDPGLAARILWFDALIGNVDRSWRNPNMLLWHGRVQLIDHGAALIFHHAWSGLEAWPPARTTWRPRPRRYRRRRRRRGRGARAAGDGRPARRGGGRRPRRLAGGRARLPGPDAVRDAYVGQLPPGSRPATRGCPRCRPLRRDAAS